MTDFYLRLNKTYSLTWGFDGLVIVRGSDFATNIGICLPHHRVHAGVQKAQIEPLAKYIVTLGREGVLACTLLTETQDNSELSQLLETIHKSDDFKLMFSRRTIGFVPKGKYEGKCYLEVQELERIEKERIKCASQRTTLLREFRSIQTEVQTLLTANITGPENEQLSLSEFDMHVQLHTQKATEHKKQRKAMEEYLKQLMEAQNKVSEYMMVTFWDTMLVRATAIKGIFAKFQVLNYVLLPPNTNREVVMEWIRQQRKLEGHLNDMNSFHAWEPIPEQYYHKYF